MNIGICGGGNIAHAIAAYTSWQGNQVYIYTRHPELWGKVLQAQFPSGHNHACHLTAVAHTPKTLQDCEIIIIALPRFAIEAVCKQIKPYLQPKQLVLIVPGSPYVQQMYQDPNWSHVPLAALYKVPFISRTTQYGHSVSLTGFRDLNRIWLNPMVDVSWLSKLETLFCTPLQTLSSAWPFLLTNSNPLLHPARLSILFNNFREGMSYERNFLFYEEWTDESSELYLAADAELLQLCDACPGMMIGKDIVPVKEYYHAPDAASLTKKIRSIAAFKGITSPMKQLQNGRWVPDFSSRYFTEDIAWGTEPICQYAQQLGIAVPTIESFVAIQHHLPA